MLLKVVFGQASLSEGGILDVGEGPFLTTPHGKILG